MSLNWDVRIQDLVAFHIPVKRTFFGWFEKGARVAEGTTALLFDGGAYVGNVPAGTWTHRQLAERLGASKKAELSAVLVDAGHIELPQAFHGLVTADGHPLDVDLVASVRVHEAQTFFLNLLKQRPRVTAGDLAQWLAPRMANAAAVAVGRFPLEKLQAPDRDVRLLLESELDRELKLELRRVGVDLLHLSSFRARNERVEAVRERQVNLHYDRQDFEQDKAEEQLRRDKRVFDEDGTSWDENQDVVEAKNRLRAWQQMSEIVRNRKILGAGDIRELKDALDEQSAQYAKSGALRQRDLDRFREDIEWDGFLKGMERADERADVDQKAKIAELARKQVLQKLLLAQQAELQTFALERQAEVEATKLRIAAQEMGQEADVKRLALKIEHDLNELFYPGKARELELEESVQVLARKAAQAALAHEIDLEAQKEEALVAQVRRKMGLDKEVSAHKRSEKREDVALQVDLNDVVRTEQEKDFVAGLHQEKRTFDETQRQRGALADMDDYEKSLDHERERKRKDEKWARQKEKLSFLIEQDKALDEHDQKIADRVHARFEEAAKRQHGEKIEVKKLDQGHELDVLGSKQGHEQALKQLDNADSANQREHETAQLAGLGAAASPDHIYAVKNANSAASFHEKEARVAEANAKHSAEVAEAKLAAVQAERDRSDGERRQELERQAQAARDAAEERRREADRLERLVNSLAGGVQQQAASVAQQQANAQAQLLEETRRRADKMEQVSDRTQDRMVDMSVGRKSPGGVNVNVSVNSLTCGACQSVAPSHKQLCPQCGTPLR